MYRHIDRHHVTYIQIIKFRGVMVDGKLVEVAEPILAVATLEIFDGMTLDPAQIILPWNPTKKGKLAVFLILYMNH